MVNIYDTITLSALRSCRRVVVAIKARILYSRLLPVVPHFSPAFSFPLFTRCHCRIPHSRFLPITANSGFCERMHIHFVGYILWWWKQNKVVKYSFLVKKVPYQPKKI